VQAGHEVEFSGKAQPAPNWVLIWPTSRFPIAGYMSLHLQMLRFESRMQDVQSISAPKHAMKGRGREGKGVLCYALLRCVGIGWLGQSKCCPHRSQCACVVAAGPYLGGQNGCLPQDGWMTQQLHLLPVPDGDHLPCQAMEGLHGAIHSCLYPSQGGRTARSLAHLSWLPTCVSIGDSWP